MPSTASCCQSKPARIARTFCGWFAICVQLICFAVWVTCKDGMYGKHVDLLVYNHIVQRYPGMHLEAATQAKHFEFLTLGASLQVSSIPGVYTEPDEQIMRVDPASVTCGFRKGASGLDVLLHLCGHRDSIGIRTFSECGKAQPPQDLKACLKRKVWGEQDTAVQIGGKVLGYVFAEPAMSRWIRMELTVKQSCGETPQRKRRSALSGSTSSAIGRLSQHDRHASRQKLGIGVHWPALTDEKGATTQIDLFWPKHVMGMMSARDLMVMMHAAHWNTLPLRATSDVREVPAPAVFGKFDPNHIPEDGNTLPWHQRIGPKARVSFHSRTYERFNQQLRDSLQLLCPAHMPGFPHLDQSDSVVMMQSMAMWLGISANKTEQLTKDCGVDSRDAAPQARRMSVVWMQVIDVPLLRLKPGEPEECQPPGATWQHFRSLVLEVHGMYHTVPSDVVQWVRQHGAAGVTRAGQTDRSFVRVAAIASVDGIRKRTHAFHETVVAPRFYYDVENGTLSNVRLRYLDAFKMVQEQFLAAGSQSDILVCMSQPILQSVVTLPPWGGVVELVSAGYPPEASMAQAMAHRLGLAHMRVQVDIVEVATMGLLRIPGRLLLTAGEHRPFAQAVFTAALEEMVTEVRRRRRVWLQEHAASGGSRSE